MITYHEKKKREEYLRSIIRQGFGKAVEWVEPAFGSTPGLPDCNLDIGGSQKMPVELKAWELNKKGVVVAAMRPAQIRYHVMGSLKKKRSAILFSIPMDDEEFNLYLLNGKHCPKDKIEHEVHKHMVHVGNTTHLRGSIRYFLVKKLNEEAFWA